MKFLPTFGLSTHSRIFRYGSWNYDFLCHKVPLQKAILFFIVDAIDLFRWWRESNFRTSISISFVILKTICYLMWFFVFFRFLFCSFFRKLKSSSFSYWFKRVKEKLQLRCPSLDTLLIYVFINLCNYRKLQAQPSWFPSKDTFNHLQLATTCNLRTLALIEF